MTKRFTTILVVAALTGGTMAAQAAVIPAEGALQRGYPAQETFTLRMSFGADYGRAYGMAGVSFNSAKDVVLNMQSSAKAKLYYEGTLMGEVGVVGSDYSGITNLGIQLTDDGSGLLEFEATNAWLLMFNAMGGAKYRKTGEYTVEIPEGLFKRGDDLVGGITYRYELVDQLPEPGPEPPTPGPGWGEPMMFPFEHVFVPGSPTRTEFSLSTSYRAEYGTPYGMAAIALNCPKEVVPVEGCTEKVQLYRGDTLLCEVGLDDKGNKGIRDIGIAPLADDTGLIDFGNGMTTYLFMFDAMRGKEFQQAGTYTFKMPTGLFRYEDAMIEGGEMTFTYQGDVPQQFTWSITPEEGAVFSVDDPIPSVTLTIDGYVNMLDYAGTPGALYNPDGQALAFETRWAKVRNNTITWSFKENKKNPVDWKPGEYTFRLPARSININTWADYVEGTFPEKEIRMMYVLEPGTTGVTVIGGEKAESYTVYTLDGRCVAREAGYEVFGTLQPGIYIVNGRKVRVMQGRACGASAEHGNE